MLRLRAVHITTSDVFEHTSGSGRPFAELVNALHWQTDAEVVRRELWFGPGDEVDDAKAAELERNLRALGLFADVQVRLVPTGTPGEVDLEVVTRDRLTLALGAGASYVGGVTGVRGSIGEANLFGQGDRLVASFSRNSEDEYRGSVAYTDLHLFDSWHTGTLRYARTDDGDSYGAVVRRPFKHRTDPRAYGAALGHDELSADYFLGGDTVAEVPYERDSLQVDLAWGAGPRDRRRQLGVLFALDRIDYGTATGPLAPQIRVPGDTGNVVLGPTAAWQWIAGYRKVEGLDTLQYVQDLTLGASVGATVAARWRDEQRAGGDVQPEATLRAAWAGEPLADLFVTVGADGGVRYDSGDLVGWQGGAWLRAFALASERHTLGVGSTFDAVEELQDLPRQLTLGEDNGLRGYRARQFAGTRRLRTNVEHRFDTGIEFATLRLGTVLFFDSGHVGQDHELGRAFRSVGIGLRIGSKPLLGDGVLRLDVAKPLDDVPGENDGWKLSLSVGQVFTFGSLPGLGMR